MINYIVHDYIDIKPSHVNWKTFVLKKLNIQNAKRHKIFKIPYYILRYLNRPLFSISFIVSAWTFTILLSDIVNLFKYFYYMYTSLSTVKIKIKKKFEQFNRSSKNLNSLVAIDSSFGVEKRRRKFQKLVKKKSQGKSSVSALVNEAWNEAWNTVRVRGRL